MNDKTKRERERQELARNPELLWAYDQGYKTGFKDGRISGWKWATQAIRAEIGKEVKDDK